MVCGTIRGALLVVLFAYLVPSGAQARSCVGVFSPKSTGSSWFTLSDQAVKQKLLFSGRFLFPNEVQPLSAREGLEQVGEGLIIGVGTERLIFDALLAPQATGILAIDYEKEPVQFHRVNAALMRAVPKGDHESYLRARLAKRAEQWRELVHEASRGGRLNEQDVVLLSDASVFRWWKKRIVNPKRWRAFYEPKDDESKQKFQGVRYHQDPKLFSRIQTLARSGRYRAHVMDLGNPDHLEALVGELARQGERVALLDLSNAWEHAGRSRYLGNEKTGEVLKAFDQISMDHTIAMMTFRSFVKEPFYYRAFTFGFYRSLFPGTFTSWEELVRNMEGEREGVGIAEYEKWDPSPPIFVLYTDPSLFKPSSPYPQTGTYGGLQLPP